MKNRIIITTMAIALLHIVSITTLKIVSNITHLVDSTEEACIDKIKMASLAYGAYGALFTIVSNQLNLTNSGRSSSRINSNTFAGKDCGMPKCFETDCQADILEIFKFGYGSLKFGCLFIDGDQPGYEANLLLACNIGFQESYPKTESEYKASPVFEPSLYAQIALGELFRVKIGLSNRYGTESRFSFTNDRWLSGVSIYIAFLVGTCNGN